MPEIEQQLREQLKTVERLFREAKNLLHEASGIIPDRLDGAASDWHDKYSAFLFPAHDCKRCGRIEAGCIDPCDIPY